MANQDSKVEINEIFRSKWRVSLQVSGKPEDVGVWIHEYERQWPSAGYGTFSKKTATFENGDVVYEITRSTSCD